jgi:hypothetical protein
LGFADLLRVAEKLITVLQGFIPGTLELNTGGFAFNDQQRATLVVFDQNVSTASTGTSTQLPLWFQLNVLGLIALFQQAMHTFENYKIFIGFEVAGLALVNDQSSGLGVTDFFLGEIHFQDGIPKCLAVNRSTLVETERIEQVSQIVLSQH